MGSYWTVILTMQEQHIIAKSWIEKARDKMDFSQEFVTIDAKDEILKNVLLLPLYKVAPKRNFL